MKQLVRLTDATDELMDGCQEEHITQRQIARDRKIEDAVLVICGLPYPKG